MKLLRIVSVFLLPLVGVQPLLAQKVPALQKWGAAPIAQLSRQQLITRIARLEAENARLAIQIAQEKAYQAQLFTRLKRATFRAVPTLQGPSNSYTGTVFAVTHNGKQEVFGVIAAHALQDKFNTPGLLNKDFTTAVVQDDRTVWAQAHVVQLSSNAMGDLALVKFAPQDETLFEPLTLPDTPVTLPAQGYAQGYACNLLAKQTFPIVGQTSIGLLQARLPATGNGQRAGFCGSPIFSKDFQFVGIHVGSSYQTQAGFIAPVTMLKHLVDAYHAPGATPQVLTLAGRELARLAAHEYVTRLELLDAQQHVLWSQETRLKFSLRQAEAELTRRPNVAFVRLTVGQTLWEENDKGGYVLNDDSSPRTLLIPWTSTAP